ncbi:MAG: DUF2336 domain-containing protein [Rhodospirillaceae bacterium]|nr:DUF2336 domain-containing protein [Rhodospirillaceae bacterium]
MATDKTPSAHGLTTADYLAAEAKLTAEEKAALASHLAASLGATASKDFAEAEAVLRLMTWNAEPRVIDAMAKAAAVNPNTPRSIAWALANDDENAAAMVLEMCASLADDDLVSLVQAGSASRKMCAIARRATVSEEVSKSLVAHGDEDAVHTLLANAKAKISDDAYGTALDRFGQSERIQEDLIARPAMSAPLAQRLSAHCSPELKDKLAAKLAAQAPTAMPGYYEALSDAEWAAAIKPMIRDSSAGETLVRQVLQGYLELFIRALAAWSKAPYAEVRAGALSNPPGLAPFWTAAALAKDWLPVAMAAVEAVIYVDQSAGKSDRDLFARNVIARTQANLKAAKVTLTDAQKRFFMRAGR